MTNQFCNCKHESRHHTVTQGCLYAGCQCKAYVKRPHIVVLCGSTRFYDQFMKANYEETLKGHIVLSVGFFVNKKKVHGEGIGIIKPEVKLRLDDLHKRKIDLADEVLVLNVDGYIGDSTRSEIQYAERLGKPIRWLEQPS